MSSTLPWRSRSRPACLVFVFTLLIAVVATLTTAAAAASPSAGAVSTPKGFSASLYCGICKAIAPALVAQVEGLTARDEVVDRAANFCANNDAVAAASMPVKQACPKLLGSLTRAELFAALRGTEDPRRVIDTSAAAVTRRLCVNATSACDDQLLMTESPMERALLGKLRTPDDNTQPSVGRPKEEEEEEEEEVAVKSSGDKDDTTEEEREFLESPVTVEESFHLQEQLKKDPNLAKFKPAALIKAQRRAILANKRKLKQKFEQLDLEDKPRRDAQRIAREKEEAGKLAEEEERRRAYLAEEELREATQEKVPDGGTGVSKDPNLVRDEL